MPEQLHTATVSDLRRKTATLLKLAEEQPVMITRYGKPTFVLMSAQHYHNLSGKQ